MATVDELWLAALTKDEDDAGTSNRFNLTVNIDGIDVFDQDFNIGLRVVGQGQVIGGLRQGQAGVQGSGPLPTPFESSALTNSSIRLGIRGYNAWAPRHVLLIGRTRPSFEPGRILALAMETDLTDWLSSTSSEGHLTMRVRLVGPGDSATVIRRVLLLVYTHTGSGVQTDNTVQLQIGAGGSLALHQQISDDFERYTARWYFFDVEAPFTRGDIVSNGSIQLSVLGTDAWLPKTVFVLGLDSQTGRPNDVVCLAAIPEWDLGWLSANAPPIHLPVSI